MNGQIPNITAMIGNVGGKPIIKPLNKICKIIDIINNGKRNNIKMNENI